MISLRITPRTLKGTVVAPPSKSMAHRLILAASLTKKEISRVDNVEFSEDIQATLNCVKTLGAEIDYCSFEDNIASLKIEGLTGKKNPYDIPNVTVVLDCGESGTALRLLRPVAATLKLRVKFSGRGKLMERPQDTSFTDRLKAGKYELRGDVSSQFISGLLFALPNVRGKSEIIVTGPIESKGYIEMTLNVLRQFGIQVECDGLRRFTIKGPQKWKPCDTRVEGDWSQAAFWLVARAIGNDVTCEGVDDSSAQGDKVIADIIRNDSGEAIEIDICDTPDLAPILAVWLSCRKGGGRIVNAGRLRMKECDRLKAIVTELNKIGGKLKEHENEIEVEYVPQFKGGEVDGWNDHRIAMALAIASTRCSEDVIIHGANCVNKSYPNFWKVFSSVGGKHERLGK